MSDSVTITPDRQRGGFLLQAECVLPRTLEEVFPFFADAHNLQQITPPWLDFHIVTPGEIDMQAGALIDYKLRLRGIPIRWRTRISEWEPQHRFVDEMLRGPYRWWHHEHLFEFCDAGTRVIDRVHYGVPGGALVHRLVVGRDVQKIFEYRQATLRELFRMQPTAAVVV